MYTVRRLTDTGGFKAHYQIEGKFKSFGEAKEFVDLENSQNLRPVGQLGVYDREERYVYDAEGDYRGKPRWNCFKNRFENS